MVVTVWAVTVSQTFSVIVLLLLLCFQEFLKLVFIYVCVGSLLMLGLFSSFDEQGILYFSCSGFRCCRAQGSRVHWPQHLWHVGSVVVSPGL